MAEETQTREGALELLRSQHQFPGPFAFRVVVRPESQAAVVSVVVATAGPQGDQLRLSQRSSRTGKYVSVRIEVQLQRAEEVLEVYEILRGVEGVLTIL